MDSLVLKNILLPDASLADIHIEGETIRAVVPAGGTGDAASPAGCPVTAIDCTGKMAMPGFVNMHTHAAMSLMRGVGEDVLFHRWLDRIWNVESKIDAEYVYWGTKAACVEMLRTGTTLFNDHYWYASAAHRAAVEMGIRPVESYVFLDRFDENAAAVQKERCIKAYEESEGWPGRGMFTVGIHSIYSVSEKTMLWAADFARRHGLRIHIHLSETKKEVDDCMAAHGMSPVEYLDSLGMLGPDLIAAHTLWLSEHDVELLGANHVNCVHNINSNLKLASGYRFLYNELKAAGANVCIGTDGCASSNNLDILEALKTAAMVQKAWRGDPSAMPLGDLVEMATVNGARALGYDTGVIAPGKDADILIIDTLNTFFLSPGSPLANLVYSAHSSCIESVICKGRFVMRDGTVPGEQEILSEARKTLSKII